MTLLTPIPAIIAAALAVPAVLLIYFLKLRRRPVRVGSTMLWVQAAEDLQANVPFKWLHPSLLLLLQLLILGSLLLALARPALLGTGAMPGQVFIVIDRSASMRASDLPGGATRFDEARRLARRIIERTAVGSFEGEISLVGFAARAEVVAGPTRSRGELLAALDLLGPTDEPGDLAGALRLVQALATPEDPESPDAPRALVVVCSDGSMQGEPPAIRADVVFERAAPEAREGDNLGIVALAARRDAESPAILRVFARIGGNLSAPTTVGIALRLDGQALAQEAVEIEGATGAGPAQTPVSMQIPAPAGGLVTLSIERADALAADNAASLLVEPPRRPSVLLVRAEESESAGAGWLLTDVLRELDLAALRLVSAQRVRELGADAFRDIDLAIFDGAPSPGAPPVASLHFGHPPPLPELAASAGRGAVEPVLAWDRSHPLLRDVALDAVRIGQTSLLSPTDQADTRTFAELVRTAQGVVAAAIEHDRTPHVVCGFELVQSTWPVHYSFPIFLANAVETLPRNAVLATGWSARTGEPVILPQPVASGAPLTDPSGSTRPLPAQAAGDGPLTRLGVLDAAGVWRVGGAPVPVNLLDERESSLEAPRSLTVPGAQARAGERTRGAAEPREIWPWLLIGAAGLLLVEWLLFGLRVRV